MNMHETSATTNARAAIPFRAKLTMVGAFLAVVPLVAVGWALVQVSSNTIRTMSREYQLSVAGDLARTIESEFQDAQNGLDAVGRVLTNEAIPEETAIQLAINMVGSNEVLDHVGLYTRDGELVDVIREQGVELVHPPAQLDEKIRATINADNVATGTVIHGQDYPRVLLAVPLYARGNVSGYAASLVSLERLQERVKRLVELRFEGLQDSLLVVDDQQRIIASANVDDVQRLMPAAGVGILEGVDPAALTPNFMKSGEFTGVDRQKMVGTVIGLRTRPWAIVAQVPRAIAYAPLDTMTRIIKYTSIAAIVLALLLAVAIARQITQPILQLAGFARDLAARRFDKRVTVHTRDELAFLGDAMSMAAANLEESEKQIRKEEAIRGDLGRYLPAAVVDKVVRREQDMRLGGERREVTVLFADVVSFTPIAESLHAEATVGLLNELFTILTEIVFRHHGTVDKFIGDSIMAVWGAPEAQPNHAELALRAAEDMLRWLEAGNRGWQAKFGVTLELAIGVNTGEVVVGNVGSETRMQYTAIGDAVNLAARMETIARPQQILISRTTRQAAGDSFRYESLGERQLAGRTDSVELFEVRV